MKTTTNPDSIRPPIVARKFWEVRREDGDVDFFPHEEAARLAVDLDEDSGLASSLAPVLILPADADIMERVVEQVARATDGLAFHIYKSGDCLPRGHETETVENVNKIQGFRQRSALSDARKALRSLGILTS